MAELSDQLSQFQGPLYTGMNDPDRPLERPEPRPGELDGYAAPGTDAQVEVGVLYRGDHETLDDGVCRAVRLHARALHDAGLPVRLQTIANLVRYGDERFLAGSDMLLPEVLAQVEPMRKLTVARAGIVVVHAAVWSAMGLWRIALPIHVQREGENYVESLLRRTILCMPWERSVCSEDLAAAMNRLGQVWLACRANVDAFVSSGVEASRIRLVPMAYDPNALVCRLVSPVRSGKRFYTIGKWEPRKGHHNLIGAFLLAHRPEHAATLMLKTHGFGVWDRYPKDAEESIRTWLEDEHVRENGWNGTNVGSRLRVEERVFTDAQIARLHEINNIYVSASHAEQWDYPAFDALCAGNQLVHVGYGASADYAPDTAIQVPWEPGPVHLGYHWESQARWAHYSVVALEDALRKAVPPARRIVPPSLERCSQRNVGAQMRACVLELAAERGVALSTAPTRTAP